MDLSGGWYDAGDHLKFSFTMAWTVATLSWGLLEFPDAYDSVGEYEQMLDTIKWCVCGIDRWLLTGLMTSAHPPPPT